MPTGAITEYIDVAQITLYVFWAFFAGLIYYLHRENKREGYPLENERSAHVKVQGWPPIPEPKTYRLRDGSTVTAPNDKRSAQRLAAEPVGAWLGAPLRPTGHLLLDGVGPGAYADRADVPDTTVDGEDRLVPLRLDPAFGVAQEDPDPRGMEVIGADGQVGGICRDLWVDRAEMLFRYLEVEVSTAAGPRRVLLPINFARVDAPYRGFVNFVIGRTKPRAGRILVRSILSTQFAEVPGTRAADRVTMLEEEKIMAYYGAGTLYATPQRQEPLL